MTVLSTSRETGRSPCSGDIDLTLSYCALADRADDITLPPSAAGAEVLVCLQGASAELAPDPAWDAVVHVPGRGVARSRNAAVEHAGRRYLLLCDDDVAVDLAGVRRGIAFLQETGAAVAMGRATDQHGRLRKRYGPERPTRLHRYNSAKAATYELLIDTHQVRAAGVRFDERFGAGMPLYLGDEYIFIADLLEAGLTGYAVPHVFGMHPADSSGTRWGGRDLAVRSAVLDRVFGRTAPAARLAFGMRHRQDLGGLTGVMAFALGAAGSGRRPCPGRPAAAATDLLS